jgi:hypothetical protein
MFAGISTFLPQESVKVLFVAWTCVVAGAAVVWVGVVAIEAEVCLLAQLVKTLNIITSDSNKANKFLFFININPPIYF